MIVTVLTIKRLAQASICMLTLATISTTAEAPHQSPGALVHSPVPAVGDWMTLLAANYR
jgi:hypothetical protein